MNSRQLKVIHIVQNYYPYDIRVRKFTDALVRNRHAVTVICIGRPEDARYESLNGVSVYRIKLSKKRGNRLRYYYEYFTFFFRSIHLLNKLDKKVALDVVHIHTMPDVLVLVGLLQKAKGKKIIMDHHEPLPELYQSKYGAGPGHPMVYLLKGLEKLSMQFVDCIVTVTNELKQLIQKRSVPKARIEVIMNTVDQTVVTIHKKKPHPGFNCVYHGTIFPRHGLDTALEALAAVGQEGPDINLHIFGEGSALPQLQNQCVALGIQNRVFFNEVLPYQKLVERLSEMDLGIIPLVSDQYWNLAFPNKLGEYVFLKIPVVISDLKAIRNYFTDHEVLYFESGNPQVLAQKILYAYKERGIMEKRAESAFKKYRDIDWTVMSRRYLKLLEDLCS